MLSGFFYGSILEKEKDFIMKTKIFYSYSHQDETFRQELDKSLAILKHNEIIDEWHDRKIIAGQKWKGKILQELKSSEIIIFLVSPDFLSSPACKEEWDLAKELTQQHNKQLISIVVRPCSWKDFDDMADYLVLPTDGKEVSKWGSRDAAWLNVYEGIKQAISFYKENYQPKEEYIESITEIEFCSQDSKQIRLNEIFVFPFLEKETSNIDRNIIIGSSKKVFELGKALLVGDEQSGKSKLCVHLFLEAIEQGKKPILVDLQEVLHKKPKIKLINDIFDKQFSGDFDEWIKSDDKIIVLDNFINHRNANEYLDLIQEHFSKVFISLDSDTYESFYKDDKRLSEYEIINIRPFSLVKQEQLIRNWLKLRESETELYEGEIDLVENNINEIIIDNKILPRYPFFILSILQTHEAFMPKDIKITAYGHCYYALILANLIKAGVDKKDDAIGNSMKFCSHLASFMHSSGVNNSIDEESYNKFVAEYENRFILTKSLLNRVVSSKGLVKKNDDGFYKFNLQYSYYFFLGKYLAENYHGNKELVNDLVEKSYVSNNTFIIAFTIHHSSDMEIVDNILTHTMCALDELAPAKLDKHETDVLIELLKSIPGEIVSNKSVKEQRKEIRDAQDKALENNSNQKNSELENQESLGQIFLAHKNMEILSQILKNKYGQLEKNKVKELIEIICDAGLRLVKVLLFDKEQLKEYTDFIYKGIKESNKDIAEQDLVKGIKKELVVKMFLWTMGNIEKAVSSINKREVKELIFEIKEEKNTPAYDLIYYFYMLDSSLTFSEAKKKLLIEILGKYNSKDYFFMNKVLSIRTQYYFNTHSVKAILKQEISSLLGVEYKPG